MFRLAEMNATCCITLANMCAQFSSVLLLLRLSCLAAVHARLIAVSLVGDTGRVISDSSGTACYPMHNASSTV